MTATASKLVQDFTALEPDEQRMVREQIDELTIASQRAALDLLKGSMAGTNALALLLEERARDREREERKAAEYLRESQLEALRRLDSADAGKDLVNDLLEERARDRARE